MTRLPPWSAAAALGCALAWLVLWPGIATPTQVLVGHESLDVWSHAWGQAWAGAWYWAGPEAFQAWARPAGGRARGVSPRRP